MLKWLHKRLLTGRKLGDLNNLRYLRDVPVDGLVVEIGSKQHGNTPNFRSLYPNYIGLDLEPGEGVDRVCDIERECPDLQAALVICCSVLEHVQRPWIAAENIAKLVRPGGQLYISVPWVWKYHAYPDDYWRFSWRGIQVLFPGFVWEQPMYSTTSTGADFFEAVPGSDGARAVVTDGVKFLPYLMVHMIGSREC